MKTSRSLPTFTVFYGASCSGIHGSWFFNTVQGGGTDTLRPTYSLQWSFPGKSEFARPSARIRVADTKRAQATVSIHNGQVRLTGVRKPNIRVNATGTLFVKVIQRGSSPSLMFVENGLYGAEHKLGLSSPFDAGGHPLVVPISHVESLAGC